MRASERIDEEHEEQPGVDAYMVVSYGADGVDVGAVVLKAVRVGIFDFKGWRRMESNYLLRIWTCALVGRLAGTSSAVGMGLGNIRSAGTRG